MRILYINNDGGGFADYIEVEPGLTVEQLFALRLPAKAPEDYLVRVNRMPVAADQVLQESDRISFTPVKIEGAEADSRSFPLFRRLVSHVSPCNLPGR